MVIDNRLKYEISAESWVLGYKREISNEMGITFSQV